MLSKRRRRWPRIVAASGQRFLLDAVYNLSRRDQHWPNLSSVRLAAESLR